MTSLKAVLLGTALGALTIGTAHAGYVTIDEFNGPDMTISQHGVGSYSLIDNQATLAAVPPGAISPTTNVIGGYRDLSLQITTTAGSGSNVSTSEVFLDGANGTFAHSQGTNIASRSTLTWNGLNTAPGLNANFAGLSGIAIGVNYSDQGLTWVLELTDGTGKKATKEFNTTDISVATEVVQLFSAFTIDAGFDFTDVDAISFVANKNLVPSLDTEVDYIRAIPEPATLALLGAGLLGLGMVRRRKA
jgi:hypothetical protein